MPENSISNRRPTQFLTLGDGDMSFSVDMCQWLQSKHQADTYSPPYHVIASGIDSYNELLDKYKDAPSLLKSLTSMNSDRLMKVTVLHEVDALNPPPTTKPKNGGEPQQEQRLLLQQNDHVIFNHPHLGTEDAVLHGQFLCHLFYTCRNFWLAKQRNDVPSLLHITLVAGQYKRWNCEQAAKRHGFVLMGTNEFRPPQLLPQTSTKAKYQHRRHQSGKSFVQRAKGGSFTYTFVLKEFATTAASDSTTTCHPSRSYCLPWQHVPPTTEQQEEERKYVCKECNRYFAQERSLKSHVQSVHQNRKRKANNNLACPHCKRQFQHEQSLTDHIRAKHTVDGQEVSIQPEWAAAISGAHNNHNEDRVVPTTDNGSATVTTTATDESSATTMIGECLICGQVFQSELDKERHKNAFLPTREEPTECCQFCSNSFASLRARLQHENFCKARAQRRRHEDINSVYQRYIS